MLSAALLAATAACSYDTSRLRRDAGATCTSRPTINANDLQSVLSGSIVAESTTTGAPNILTPPTFGLECNRNFMGASPEVVYRYRVGQAGSRLYATTDAQGCSPQLDTVVYMTTDCNQAAADGGTVLACSDDDHVLNACMCGPNGCPGFASGTIADGLTPGQTVYVVVDGFSTNSGNFRLVMAENGVANAPPPDAPPMGLTLADRCSCPAGSDLVQSATVTFPGPGDIVMGSRQPALATPGDQLVGMHRVPLSSFGGAALEMRLGRVVRNPTSDCDVLRLTFDLVINHVVVQSFMIDPNAPAPAPMRVAYQTFGAVTLPSGTDVPIALRLREVTPNNCGGAVEFDTSTPGTLTLLGTP